MSVYLLVWSVKVCVGFTQRCVILSKNAQKFVWCQRREAPWLTKGGAKKEKGWTWKGVGGKRKERKKKEVRKWKYDHPLRNPTSDTDVYNNTLDDNMASYLSLLSWNAFAKGLYLIFKLVTCLMQKIVYYAPYIIIMSIVLPVTSNLYRTAWTCTETVRGGHSWSL